MGKRRYHCKSKNGCTLCKKRRVKCDETGPPCTNCRLRRTPCSYAPGTGPGQGDELAMVATDAGQSVTTDSSSPSSSSSAGQKPEHVPSVLEMRLMLQWSTSTYLTMCSIEEEHELMQVFVPRHALKYGFLLDGILAVAALEIAVTMGDDNQTDLSAADLSHAAAEYCDRALGAFRELVMTASRETLTPDLHLAMFMFSCFAGVLNLVTPQPAPGTAGDAGERSVLGSVIGHFDMIFGAGQIAKLGWDWLQAGPMPTNARPNWETDVHPELLDVETKAAMARLQAINAQISSEEPLPPAPSRICVVVEGVADDAEATPPPAAQSEREMYAGVITRLEEYFVRTCDLNTKGFGIIWPTVAGEEYSAAVRRSDPLALYIIMHWGVLLYRMGRDYWWTPGAGQRLVREMANLVRYCPHGAVVGWEEGILWALREIGDFTQ